MDSIRKALGVIRANRKPYFAINGVYYGLVLCGMLVSSLFPAVQRLLMANIRASFESGLFSAVVKAYQSGNVPLAALLTFAINSALGAFAVITLPSIVIPFAGCAAGFIRATTWGLMLSPTNPRLLLAMLPHSIVLLLEGQAYVLAAFGCYLWGKWFLRPGGAGFATRADGYRAGFRANVQLYALILPLLAVSAVYEAVEVIAASALLRS